MPCSAPENNSVGFVGLRLLAIVLLVCGFCIRETGAASTVCREDSNSGRCCGTTHIYDLTAEGCCSPGNIAILSSEKCCAGKVIGKYTGCCRNVKMDKGTHLCCPGGPTRRDNEQQDKCCENISGTNTTAYDGNTHFCHASGRVIQIDPEKPGRCEDEQFDPDEKMCCFGALNKKFGPNGAEMKCCGASTRSFNTETETCCYEHVYTGPHMCIDGQAIPCLDRCDGVCYDKETQTCCHGRHVHPLGHECEPPRHPVISKTPSACQTISLSELEDRPRKLCGYDMAIVARTKATTRGTTLRFDSHGPLWISTGHRGHQPPTKLKIKSCQLPQQPEHRVFLLQRKKNGKLRAKLVLGDFEEIESFIERQSASACEQGRKLRHGYESRTSKRVAAAAAAAASPPC